MQSPVRCGRDSKQHVSQEGPWANPCRKAAQALFERFAEVQWHDCDVPQPAPGQGKDVDSSSCPGHWPRVSSFASFASKALLQSPAISGLPVLRPRVCIPASRASRGRNCQKFVTLKPACKSVYATVTRTATHFVYLPLAAKVYARKTAHLQCRNT